MLSEVLQGLGLDEVTDTIGFKCIVLGKCGVYIEGVKRVIKFTDEQIILKVRRSRAVIVGHELILKRLTKGEALVRGEIERVEFLSDIEHSALQKE